MKTKRQIEIRIDENQRNCIVAGLIHLQMEMHNAMSDEPRIDRIQWLTQQIAMMDDMIEELNSQFK